MPPELAMSHSGRNQFSITITLNPRMYKFCAEDQYDMTAEALYEYFRLKSPFAKYTFVAELTPMSCNIHYHGIVEFTNKSLCETQARKWLADLFRNNKIYGHKCKLDLITELPKWIEYILKDKDKTKKVINRRPIVVDELNLLPDGMEDYMIGLHL